ncbi:MAG TPA: xanthine dehydrogenase family protein molybdopterin-binding subunit, partial [Alphaproteobacteria bacterium]|nr:xanthine dehydrogenase family protein molybdopterin-binding subunit [Alphaproteobacteria bacterium]
PHGEIRGIDTAAALQVPGVLAVYTGRDLVDAGLGLLLCKLPLKSHDGRPLVVPPRPPLAVGRVRHVGDPVAVVVAESRLAARDGAEAVEVDIAPLPAVTGMEAAVAPGAPAVWPDEAPDNVCLDFKGGDEAAVEEAFAGAAHVTRLHIENNRLVVAAMEPRAAVAEYDAGADHYTLHVCSQGVFGMRNTLAKDVLKVEPEQVRVRTYDVGGSFGMKAPVYPEYPAILYAAKRLGRPVKWCDDRSESFLSDQAGRDSMVDAAIALDAEGTILAVRVDGLANMGAYVSTVGPNVQSGNILKNLPSVYRTPAIAVHMRCLFTNTTTVSAYRGAGRPEANYYMERLIDAAAREHGFDRIALRRRNLIPAEAIPYKTPAGTHYDSGDFPALVEAAVRHGDLAGFEARRADSKARGRLRGLGFCSYLEVTAPSAKEMGGVRFEADGSVSLITGTLNYGQGHAAAFAQVLVDRLGVPFDKVRLIQGDSDELLAGGGTGGSRSVMASGTAIFATSDGVIEKGRKLAGHVLEAAEADIEFDRGRFRVAGTDRAIPIMELAAAARALTDRPADVPESLDVALVVDSPPSAYPNGCHVCEVEIDPDTGVVEIARYLLVDDFGTLVNPMLVEGQCQGGVTQGIGQALMEHAIYDENGQPVTGSFMDYTLPRAADVPFFAFLSHPVPATTNPLGAKGCGEAGVSGALGAVMGAVNDAIQSVGGHPVEMPATPEKVWRALNGAAA